VRHVGRVTNPPLGLIAVGPLVEVTIQPHAVVAAQFTAQGLPVPAEAARLMVDTGAQRTCIDQAIAARLGLAPIRYEPMVGVSQKAENYPVFLVQMGLGMAEGEITQQAIWSAEVVGVPTISVGAHAGLIGRDFLAHFDFRYHGRDGTFELVTPVQVGTDASRREKEELRAKRKVERQARKKNRNRRR